MRPHRVLWLIPVLLVASVPAAEPDAELLAAEQTLKDAKVETDGPSLLRFFRERTLSEADRARLGDAVRRLGDDDFDTREKATAELLRAGRKALPFLRPALRDKDAERARRAAACVQELESGTDLVRVMAAARVLADRRPEGAAAALLDYLPGADDEAAEDALLRALLVVGVKDGQPEKVLLRALTDADPLRRAAAAYVLGRGAPGQREAVRRLLADADARVRFEAADALIRAGDKESVPALIALLGDGPLPLAWRAQELLYRIAGDKAPALALTDEKPTQRAKVADAWRGWWQEAAAATDLAKINLGEALQGVNVICEIPPDESQGIVWACRADGKRLWEIKPLAGPVDAQLLPNGHVLIAEWGAMQVTERGRDGKVFWTKKVDAYPTACRRLANGNTFIATQGELLELDPKGALLYSFRDPNGPIFRAHRLANGHVVYAATGRIVELDAQRKEVRSVKLPLPGNDWTSLEPLPGGRFLVAVRSANKVLELDAAGKVAWERHVPQPMSVARLPNGNALVACYNLGLYVVELDRGGKEVWKLKIDTRAFCVRRF